MDTICQICARWFDSASALQTHIKNEQTRLIRDVQDFSTKPYLPISYALTIFVRYATHSNDLGREPVNATPNHRNGPASGPTDDERNFTCPCCNDAVPRTYQGLQRHYTQHVKCDETCPFCHKTFNRVSQFVRHPGACAIRRKRKLEIPEHVSKRQRTLASDAHEKLRLAQQDPEKLIQKETNVMPPQFEISSPLRLASSLNDNSLAGSGPSLSSIANNALDVTDHRRMDYYRNSGPTELRHVPLPGNRDGKNPYPYTDMGAAERVTDSQMDRSSTRKTTQQAPMLTDAVIDGGVHSTEGASLTGMDFPYLSGLFPIQTPDMRAPILRNSLIDGTALVQDGMESYTHVPDLLPSSTISVQRAPTLSDSLIDGTMLYFESHRFTTTQNDASAVEPSSTLDPGAAEVHNTFGSSLRGDHAGGDLSVQEQCMGDEDIPEHPLDHPFTTYIARPHVSSTDIHSSFTHDNRAATPTL